jgi:hypothetical protein
MRGEQEEEITNFQCQISNDKEKLYGKIIKDKFCL